MLKFKATYQSITGLGSRIANDASFCSTSVYTMHNGPYSVLRLDGLKNHGSVLGTTTLVAACSSKAPRSIASGS
jgi:hypothetical protein